MKLWFPEVDILKATAIVLIVFSHMDNYVSSYELIRLFDQYAALIGLSIFFFISGFLLSHTDSVISSVKDVKKFYLRKFIRIYPLYWVALASLVIIFGVLHINPGRVIPYNFSLENVLLHFFGLQGIFPYTSIQSMWFVGVIVLFYLLYPIIVYFSKNLFETFVVSSLIFMVLVILHVFFGLIAPDALAYYPLFISGIFIHQIVYASKKIGDEHLLKKILFSTLILVSAIFLVLVLRKIYDVNLLFLSEILLICALISLCIFYLVFTHLFVKTDGKIMVLLSLIAFATYAIYLFQHQFLAVFTLITDRFIQNILLQDVIILTFGFAGAMLFGILIQKIELYFYLKYKSHLLQN